MWLCKYDLSKECDGKYNDCVDCVLDKIKAEINSPNRGTCDYFIVDRIEEIINKYKAEKGAVRNEDDRRN